MALSEVTRASLQSLQTIYDQVGLPDAKGRFQIGAFTKSVQVEAAPEASVAEKVRQLATLLQNVGTRSLGLGQLSSAQKTMLFRTAQTVWDSTFFKTLSEPQRKAINDMRWTYGTTADNAKYLFLNFFAAVRDLIQGTHGLTAPQQQALYRAVAHVEESVKKREFKMLSAEMSAMEKAFDEALSGVADSKATKALRTYISDFIYEARKARTLESKKTPIPPPAEPFPRTPPRTAA